MYSRKMCFRIDTAAVNPLYDSTIPPEKYYNEKLQGNKIKLDTDFMIHHEILPSPKPLYNIIHKKTFFRSGFFAENYK